ncbi:MAG: hypothetical protein HKN13_14475 [Rhodothermales bacterium]|nr:hypothetical protein [Rhodothermales bacterium]
MMSLILQYKTRLDRFLFRLGRYRARMRQVRVRESRGSFERKAKGEFRQIVSADLRLDDERAATILHAADLYASNLFDVLGSGWVQSMRGLWCRGFRGNRYDAPDTSVDIISDINDSNREYAEYVRRLIDDTYVLIDWQRDFKSGYRWSSSLPSEEARIGDDPGADIKVPWELSKLQHLSQLAVAFANSKNADDAARYVTAFRNQVLDFVSSNPPGYGANWYTSMLAGIRAANLLLSFDLFRSAGESFDVEFRNILFRSILDHARFIVRNLDWWVDDNRNNHFIANVSGLAVICAYLPESDESDDMLALAVRCLASETGHQFNKDGGSTEGSTAYHAFSAEMIGWGYAFLRSIPNARLERVGDRTGRALPRIAREVGWSRTKDTLSEQAFDDTVQPRLRSIAAFFEDCLDECNRLVQIGDNDSGRFFKICPAFSKLDVEELAASYSSLDGYQVPPGFAATYLDEDLLRYDGVGAVLSVACRSSSNDYSDRVEYHIANSLIDGIPVGDTPSVESATVNKWRRRSLRGEVLAESDPPEVFFDSVGSLHVKRVKPGSEVRLRSYPQFGVYIYRAVDLVLHVRCGGLLTLSHVGHPHSDQLSVSLSINGIPVLYDPGTFVYTAAPAARALYRGKSAHFVPAWAPAGKRRSVRVFDPMTDTESGLVHTVRHDTFVGSIRTGEGTVTRTVTISANEIVISDTNASGQQLDLSQPFARISQLPASVGYGKTRRAAGRLIAASSA